MSRPFPIELRSVLGDILRDGVRSYPAHSATLHALTERDLARVVSVVGGRSDVALTPKGRVHARLCGVA